MERGDARMHKFFTREDAARRGLSPAALRWGEQKGHWRRVARGVYRDGPEEPNALDRAVAVVVATGGVASGTLAGVLHGLDGVELRGAEVTLAPDRSGGRAGVRRRQLDPERVVTVDGVPCTDGLQTMLDLAADLDDVRWEQAFESALRKQLLVIADIDTPHVGRPGVRRIRRVLALRPPGAAPTESLLETMMLQLARTINGLPPPVRQYRVVDLDGRFVARVDLAWPELGLFIELDGEHHLGQPVYDARRETAVVAATGWLCGRFTWTEVVRVPRSTSRRLAALVDQARRRPLGAVG